MSNSRHPKPRLSRLRLGSSGRSSLTAVEDATGWVRWWRIEGRPEMRKILWEKWDPLGLCAVVRDDDWPEDEYDSYGDVLASKLKRGNDREDIVSYLTKSLIDKDTIITPAWVARCEAAAAALIQWYAHSNAPR
jgi:hypothetical protein